MHPAIRVEMYLWERQQRRQIAQRGKHRQDPNYQLQRQAQSDLGKLLGRIYLGVAFLVGLSYVFFP